MKMTLAKLLKFRSRLVERIAKIEATIKSQNSIFAENTHEVDISLLMDRRTVLTNQLVKIKSVLLSKNIELGIQDKIFQLVELKSKIVFLKQIPTSHGKVEAGGWGIEHACDKKAWIKQSQIDEDIDQCEKEIDELQEKIDIANHKTEVELTIVEI